MSYKRTLRPKTVKAKTAKAKKPTAKALKASLAERINEILKKAAAHDRALDDFKKMHRPDTSMDEEAKSNLVFIVGYLIARSNSMQSTIETVEKRERARSEAVVRQYQRPKSVDDMDEDELRDEVSRLRSGARSNY